MTVEFRPLIYRAGALLLLFLAAGCGSPNQENIRLRKLNQGHQAEINRLTTENQAAKQTITALRQRVPAIPSLPPEELSKFWLTAGLRFGRLSGGADLDPTKPGNTGLRIYINPTDENGFPIQAAGSFVVEAFDLAEAGDTHLGRWTWDARAAKRQWRASLLDHTYDLPCPWQKTPKHAAITVRVTFTDELTHSPFTAEKVIQVDLSPPGSDTPATSAPSGPTTLPSTAPTTSSVP